MGKMRCAIMAGVIFFCGAAAVFAGTAQGPADAKAIYLMTDHALSKKRMDAVRELLDTTELNAVVIDVKVDLPVLDNPKTRAKLEAVVYELNARGVWTIARIVVMQDSWLAREHPELAIKTNGGELWHSGRASWRRYWVDPASSAVIEYNIAIAKQAIDIGFREIQCDYIRFPSDGDMKDMVYPVWRGEKKYEVMRKFFATIDRELKSYQPGIVLGVDIFGEAHFNGGEPGVGQRMQDLEEFFDVIAPMNYPSHFKCGELGLKDPTAQPYELMKRALKYGHKYETRLGLIIRPWVQVFSIRSIYGCGGRVEYGASEIAAQIRAAREEKAGGYMLWNGGSRYPKETLKQILK
ncbi:MAG: hypothetical protein HZA25_00080 [Candidatus Niyogibacteria bacterium]|nr:hypothetical protein [Candidatus Niyogibacteria bacterium]